ncbi:extracellular triacylglycerol lipase precursor [Mycena floridula]|nr:extracellular triacylglycerol lipase precursor [Mycena floridula]
MFSSVLVVLLSISLTAAVNPEVKIGDTTLVGREVTLLKQDFFGGIPFAEPPIGRLRLKPPVLKTSIINGTIFDASNFGPACLQVPALIPANQLSEDCLTINVFRPSGIHANASLPVLFWTYGGGFTLGASSAFNGSAIVAQSVARGTPLIYVNFNYRLGPLGFPQGREADSRGALNLALKDQLTALEWVQLHIGQFGGDKTKVTMFGESAGAMMTAVLFLNSPLPSLARAAIFESGSAATPLTFDAEAHGEDWENFVRAVPECSALATSGNTFGCLQGANSTVIMQALLVAESEGTITFPWQPALDGPSGLYPDLPSVLFRSGHFARLPFIAGTNLDEGTAFIGPMFGLPTANYTSEVITASLLSNFSPPIAGVKPSTLTASIAKVLELYPDDPALGSPFNTGNQTFGLSQGFKRIAAIQGDIQFQSQRRLWIQTAANAGVKTFGYLFTEPTPGVDPRLGVVHGSEIPFVYGSVNTSASAQQLSSVMIDYWVSFATSLDPNDGKGIPRPTWAQYTPKNQVLMQLNGLNTTLIRDDYRQEQIAFINSDPLVFRH